MSSLIGDPIWPVLHHIAGSVGAAVGHVWSGIVNMDAGDWAGWAQFAGAMLALGVSIWLARRDGQERARQAAEAAQAQKQREFINYKIAEDLFRIVMRHRYNAFLAMINGKAKMFFDGQISHYTDSNLDILDVLVRSPLPSRRAAIDVQMMRDYAFTSRSLISFAEARYEGREPVALRALLDGLKLHLDYAYLDRTPNGPAVDDEWLARHHGRWAVQSAPDMEPLKAWYKKFELDFDPAAEEGS